MQSASTCFENAMYNAIKNLDDVNNAINGFEGIPRHTLPCDELSAMNKALQSLKDSRKALQVQIHDLNIRLENLKGEILAKSLAGDVSQELPGRVSARPSNGRVSNQQRGTGGGGPVVEKNDMFFLTSDFRRTLEDDKIFYTAVKTNDPHRATHLDDFDGYLIVTKL